MHTSPLCMVPFVRHRLLSVHRPNLTKGSEDENQRKSQDAFAPMSRLTQFVNNHVCSLTQRIDINQPRHKTKVRGPHVVPAIVHLENDQDRTGRNPRTAMTSRSRDGPRERGHLGSSRSSASCISEPFNTRQDFIKLIASSQLAPCPSRNATTAVISGNATCSPRSAAHKQLVASAPERSEGIGTPQLHSDWSVCMPESKACQLLPVP